MQHANVPLADNFTVVSNRLAQHRQLSLLAIGTALHIQSLPEGARVSIRALADRFPETEHRIGRALRELEAAGFLCRTRLRTVDGRVVTRTVSYNSPASHTPPRPAREPGRSSEPGPDPDPDPERAPEPGPGPEPERAP
ncbi:helix-turn-helix domain-containing protein, partial [Streptomyces sp. NPDC056387]